MQLDVIELVTLVVSFVALIVTYVQHRFSMVTADRPVLIFTMKSGKGWRLENVGKGPAINVVVADRRPSGRSHKVVNCYPLAEGGAIEVPWLNASHELIAIYNDVHARVYTTVCGGNVNRISRTNELPTLQADRHQWMEEAIHAGREDMRFSEEDLRGLNSMQPDLLRNAIFNEGYDPALPSLFDAILPRPSKR